MKENNNKLYKSRNLSFKLQISNLSIYNVTYPTLCLNTHFFINLPLT